MNASVTTRKINTHALSAQDHGRLLLENLGKLYGLLKELTQVAEDKLTFMREANAVGLNDQTRREHQLLQQIYRVEQERNAIIARLAQGLQRPELREVPIAEIADLMADPLKSHLHARSVGLRELAKKLKHKNAVASRVARDLQEHIRSIFAELAKSRQETVGYGPQGVECSRPKPQTIIDAVG